MARVVTLFSILSVILILSNACVLRFNGNKPGLFFRPFGSNLLIVSESGNTINLEDGSNIEAYCTFGFNHLDYFGYDEGYQKLTFQCSRGVVYYMHQNSGWRQARNDGTLACEFVTHYYTNPIANCKYTGLVFGMKIYGIPIVLAEVCYNLDSMAPTFVHYRPGRRSAILQKQALFNPSKSNYSMSGMLTFGDRMHDESIIALKRAVQEKLSAYSKFIDYKFEELIPIAKLAGVFERFTSSYDSTNLVPWWTSLKHGNWKKLTKIIENFNGNGDIEIYSGFSGVVLYPNKDNGLPNKPLIYETSVEKKVVPLYIWNYVIERNSSDSGVVVIGINSPFIEISPHLGSNSSIFCNDICDRYDWLEPLKNTRKMASLGYIFCCRPEDVKHLLPNIPQLNFPNQNNTTPSYWTTPSYNLTTPSFNYTTVPTPSFNYTTVPTPSYNWTTTSSYNRTTPSYNSSTPVYNSTTPSFNSTTVPTPSYNWTTTSSYNRTTPSYNSSTPVYNSTTPSFNSTTVPTPSYNWTTTSSYNRTTPSYNSTTPVYNSTTPSFNSTTVPTPSYNWTTTSSYNRTTPSYNSSTPVYNSTTPNFNSTTVPTPSYNWTTTSSYNRTTPSYNSSTPVYNSTTSSFNSTTVPTPSYNWTTTSSYNRTTPSYNSSTPVYNSTTPSFNSTTVPTPSYNWTTTSSYNRTTPSYNSSTPVYNSSTPSFNHSTVTTTPSYNSSTPIFNNTTPSYNWTTSIYNYTTYYTTRPPYNTLTPMYNATTVGSSTTKLITTTPSKTTTTPLKTTTSSKTTTTSKTTTPSISTTPLKSTTPTISTTTSRSTTRRI